MFVLSDTLSIKVKGSSTSLFYLCSSNVTSLSAIALTKSMRLLYTTDCCPVWSYLFNPGLYLTTVTKVRGDSEFGDKSVRDFHVPLLNFKANSLFNLIDMSDIANIHEPVQTCQISTNELDQFLLCPFPSPDVECHTQSCERAVKETTIAASKVFGFERRDGYIRAKMKSRKLVPSVKSKKSLAGMIV